MSSAEQDSASEDDSPNGKIIHPGEFQHHDQSTPSASQLQGVSFMSISSGPIPAPEVMYKYGQIRPDFPDRILKMAEAQNAHRINIEEISIRGKLLNERIGVFFAGISMLTAIIFSFILIQGGQSAVGLAALFASIGSMAGVTILTQRSLREERRMRLENMQERIDASRAQLPAGTPTTPKKPKQSKSSRQNRGRNRRR